jgi:phosphotriesterase-related protein
MIKKIVFSAFCSMIVISQCAKNEDSIIMTVKGPVHSADIGITLTHEHILVDFIGADSISYQRWNRSKVEEIAIPYLRKAKEHGCRTFIECTPAYLGRDPQMLKSITDSTGMNLITNTGYYGAADNKYLPAFVYGETSDEIAGRWIAEWENGIEGTGIRPGFIKIGVGSGNLSDLHKKIVIAAARAHLKTGLTIASHTGPSVPAFEQIEVLKEEGVSATAFIWVHAQNEKELSNHVKAAKMGAWISFDGLTDENIGEYIRMIKNMRENHLLGKVLLSHDAGWYHPGEENGGQYRGYTTLFEKLIPALEDEKFTKSEINKLLVLNPAEAFTIRIRKI